MFKDHVLSLQCHAVILAALFLDTLPPYFLVRTVAITNTKIMIMYFMHDQMKWFICECLCVCARVCARVCACMLVC